MPAAGTIGLPMIGSYLNAMLYSLELVQAYIYYFASPRSLRDHIFLKCCVATSLVSDTVGTISVCALTFVVTGAFSDTMVTPQRLLWGFQMYATSNTICSFIFQCFMVHRYWTLSRNYVVCSLIAVLILASLGANFYLLSTDLVVTRELFRTTKVHVHERWIIFVFITAMATDISITTALLWQLNRSGGYNQMNLQMKRLIARISSQAIRTGVIPFLFALITLVSYVSYKNQNIATCFAYMLGRVYTSNLLFSLIYRDKLWPGGEWKDRNAATLSDSRGSGSSPTTSIHFHTVCPVIPAQATPKGPIQFSGWSRHDSMFASMFSQEKASDSTQYISSVDSNERPRRKSSNFSLSLANLSICEF